VSRWFPERTVLWLRPQKTDPMLAEFERELDRRALGRGTRLTCVVAGDAARYRIVPWNDELVSPLQRQALSVNCFAEAYGDVARDWTVRQHTARHGVATLACALDTSLLDRLAALTQARHLGLVSVQPALMHAYNRMLRHVDQGLLWFVWIDGGWINLLLMSPDEPVFVKSLPSLGVDLPAWLDREWFVLGMEVPKCPVYVARAASASPDRPHASPESGWRFVDLPLLDDTTAFGPVVPAAPQQRSA